MDRGVHSCKASLAVWWWCVGSGSWRVEGRGRYGVEGGAVDVERCWTAPAWQSVMDSVNDVLDWMVDAGGGDVKRVEARWVTAVGAPWNAFRTF